MSLLLLNLLMLLAGEDGGEGLGVGLVDGVGVGGGSLVRSAVFSCINTICTVAQHRLEHTTLSLSHLTCGSVNQHSTCACRLCWRVAAGYAVCGGLGKHVLAGSLVSDAAAAAAAVAMGAEAEAAAEAETRVCIQQQQLPQAGSSGEVHRTAARVQELIGCLTFC